MVPRKETALTEVWFFSPYICSSFNTKKEAFLWIFLYSKVKAARVKSTRGKWINTHDLTDIYRFWYQIPSTYYLGKIWKHVQNWYTFLDWKLNNTRECCPGLKKAFMTECFFAKQNTSNDFSLMPLLNRLNFKKALPSIADLLIVWWS